MPVEDKNIKIMVVDTSTAMLHVLKNFSDKHGYKSDSFSDPALAAAALGRRFEQFDSDYRCVLLGWPEGSLDIVDDFLGMLSSTDHQDLPVLIVCQELSTEIKTMVKRRPRTRALLWKDYQSAAALIDRLVVTPEVVRSETLPAASTDRKTRAFHTDAPGKVVSAASTESAKPAGIQVLLLDDAPSVSRVLRSLMESNGYQVTVASSVAEGRKAIETRACDLVVADFFLHGEGGEEFCRYLQSADNLPGRKPVCVVTSSKYSDAVVKRSLSVGAISCLNKDESTELLFARIDALARMLPAVSPKPKADNAIVEMLELANDPSVLIDNKGVIVGLNKKASRLLGDVNRASLTGSEFSAVVNKAPIVIEQRQNAGFLTASGSEIPVSYMARNISVKGNHAGVLVAFKLQPVRLEQSKLDISALAVKGPEETDTDKAASSVAVTTAEAAERFEVLQTDPEVAVAVNENTEIEPVVADRQEIEFTTVKQFTDTLSLANANNPAGPRYCLLMLDIQLIAATGDRLGLGHSEPMLDIVKESLASLYTRDKSSCYLGDGQFGFVLANRRMQDALVLTQKLLRVVPQLVKYLNNMTLVSHGALLQLSADSPRDIDELLKKCRSGCDRARRDCRDNSALVMPMNKYLSSESSGKKKASAQKLTEV